ncbi:uncharacterized protein LOC143447174 isoform X2 [Clavelina lepadiformis]|uniref:uncharacterized protein LOC143447174 isoform X2 n=1 Tax=Clavelina lepadiformis TaxID=159417 RepID=UPI004041F2E6
MIRSEYPPLPPSLPMPHTPSDPSKQIVVMDLLQEPGNEVCADCGAAIGMENAWAILSYGILVCDDCKLVHIEHENQFKASDANDNVITDPSTQGILATQLAHVWVEKDIAQIRANGNTRSNKRLLANAPIWQYRPSANDGIKLKEYWINCKYSGSLAEAAENPKMAAKKSFIGIQFTRPMPKGTYPCCAVLQSDTLYLTSDVRNEEVRVECIETIIVNSKRIGHENGVQLTYRVNGAKDGNTVAFTYLQHDSMETVMDWVNLILYTKYNLLKRKYPTMIDTNIYKILNCGVVKESYMYIAGRGLIYLSLSEARLSCFQHHLDDTPLFQIAVSKVMNLSAAQYLDAVACFFDIDPAKILSYGDWFSALEQVLEDDKISAMPDDVPKPTFPFSLLKQPEKPTPAAPVVEQRSEPTPPAKEVTTPAPAAVTTVPQTITVTTSNTTAPAITNGEKEVEKKSSNYECYPPIGPMGEMGKVYRGELPPDAIKPPPSKNDIRIGSFGEYVPQMTQVPLQPMKTAGSYGELMNPALTSYATTLNAAATSMLNQAIPKDPLCYPPIGGPPQARKLARYPDVSLNALQAAQLRREQEVISIEELRNGAAANMLSGSMFQATLAQKPALFDNRLPASLATVGRLTDADAASVFASGIPQTSYQGWGDAAADSLLTVPWKPTGNGYEPSRGFPAATAQYQDAWNAAKMQAERKLSAPASKNAGVFGTWTGRASSVDLAQQQAMIGRSSTPWGAAASGGIDQWPSKSPTSPIDNFMLLNGRDSRAGAPNMMRDFGAAGTSRSLSMNKVSRNDSPSITGKQQVIIGNLLSHWKSAEQRLLSLIHNGYVPASDMTPAGLDKDSAEHAYTCVSELFELLWKQRYDMALSFLRGFREVFANSVHPEIRNLFIGVGELDTMKQIFLTQGKEKFFSGSAGGPVTWKQPTPPPSQNDTSWPTPTTGSVRESPTDFSPWGSLFSPTSSDSMWGGSSQTSSSRTASLSSDPWGTTSVFSSTTSAGPSFNRAPSRPVSHSQSNFGDNSPTEGSFGSKTSSNSASPRVITPPTSFDPMTSSNSLPHGIESTLKNIFLSSE